MEIETEIYKEIRRNKEKERRNRVWNMKKQGEKEEI